jgi:hypothetical protein
MVNYERLWRRIILVNVVTMLVACDQSSEQGRSIHNTESPVEIIVQPQLDALKKAEGIEELLEEQMDERHKKMEDQGI